MATTPLSFELAQQAANAWLEHGFKRNAAAKSLKLTISTFTHRLNKSFEYGIVSNTDQEKIERPNLKYNARLHERIKDGIVLIGSDAHYWPGEISAAHKAFIKVIKELKPQCVILNGDVLDGASISRHPPIGSNVPPTLTEEIEECQLRLQDIELAAPKARKIWVYGNHDYRFESRLAVVAPQFSTIKGGRLKDHFPQWETCWSVWINDDVVVKHRVKGGIHATHNNTVATGKTTITGHLHSLKVTPFNDYSGIRFGVDSGSLAGIYSQKNEPVGPQFLDYTEDGPLNWRSGFVILTFEKGELLWPEVVHVVDRHRYQYRGKVFKI